MTPLSVLFTGTWRQISQGGPMDEEALMDPSPPHSVSIPESHLQTKIIKKISAAGEWKHLEY